MQQWHGPWETGQFPVLCADMVVCEMQDSPCQLPATSLGIQGGMLYELLITLIVSW